ncbi:HD domain-containing phosphohydrolase [Clostridium saccharoperbutylacetonicum]|uniref:HD domain-containing phosphohydrolase n=1 Tax=Clostridium saccharoperbutylacetonicum TaxID=36745 RepID=UPI0039ECC3F4
MDYKLFKLLVDNMPYAIWIKDLNLKNIYVNNEYAKLFEKENIEFIGLSHEEIFGETDEKDNTDKYNLVIKDLKPQNGECRINKTRMIYNLFPLIVEEDKVMAIAGVYCNLTAESQKDKIIEQQENILKVVMDTLPGMVFLGNVAQGVLSHHERWDGNGYPLKLKGESIPLISRIVSIADSYDSMTSNDLYRKPLSRNEAINELKRCTGTQFDPDIVRVFVDYLEKTKTRNKYN